MFDSLVPTRRRLPAAVDGLSTETLASQKKVSFCGVHEAAGARASVCSRRQPTRHGVVRIAHEIATIPRRCDRNKDAACDQQDVRYK